MLIISYANFYTVIRNKNFYSIRYTYFEYYAVYTLLILYIYNNC